MIRDLMRKTVDSGVQLRRHWLHRQALEGVQQRMREAMEAVAVRHDAPPLHLVQHLAHLCRRIVLVVEKRDEAGDRPLEIDVVLPQGVIGVDEQRLRTVRAGRKLHVEDMIAALGSA